MWTAAKNSLPSTEVGASLGKRLLEHTHDRLGVLARKINVGESSASKMVHKLSKTGLVKFEKYGTIYLTPRGRETGEYLVFRHDVIESLLRLINGSGSELHQTELIEHFLDRRTVENIFRFLEIHR